MKSETRLIRVIGKIILDDDQIKRLKDLGTNYIADSNPLPQDYKEIEKRIGNASIILNNISTPISAKIIDRCPDLKFIQTWSTGVDNIDLDAAKRHGIKVANVKDYSSQSVAEKTIGLMILAANRFIEANQHVLQGGWEYQRFTGIELSGKTLCIIGSGNIGRKVGKLASAFGMKVKYVNTQTSKTQLHEAISTAHFISLHCPHNDSTHHMISTAEFEKMHGIYLINNSRGGVIDEEALVKAFENGNVRFATLDVFEHEPPLDTNPLINHPKVFATPHFTWATEEAITRLTEIAIQNIELFIHGKLNDFVV